MHEKPV